SRRFSGPGGCDGWRDGRVVSVNRNDVVVLHVLRLLRLASGRRTGSAAGSPGTEGRVFGGTRSRGEPKRQAPEARVAGRPGAPSQSDQVPDAGRRRSRP